MRESFHRELESLDHEIVRMGALVEQSTQMATTALIECDKELAQKVRDGDDEIDAVFLDIEKRSLTLLAQQAPVAGDLRLIVAILRVVNDLERSGDLAYNIAKLAQLEDFCQPELKAVRSLVAELGHAAAKLMGAAIDAWAAKDDQMAAGIALQDDVLDNLHAKLIERLVDLRGEESLASAIRLAMVGRYLERIGDHAVNLSERVRYFVTGDEEHLG
ncbi:MAG: phosphate transport system regulatory protein PhoU [Actinobacteria bacterium RBG_16_64_13]|nr:MAG: phosphate transport system regulatory protein PhoU [Actinobacteria bacterium RBG_16_64_13]